MRIVDSVKATPNGYGETKAKNGIRKALPIYSSHFIPFYNMLLLRFFIPGFCGSGSVVATDSMFFFPMLMCVVRNGRQLCAWKSAHIAFGESLFSLSEMSKVRLRMLWHTNQKKEWNDQTQCSPISFAVNKIQANEKRMDTELFRPKSNFVHKAFLRWSKYFRVTRNRSIYVVVEFGASVGAFFFFGVSVRFSHRNETRQNAICMYENGERVSESGNMDFTVCRSSANFSANRVNYCLHNLLPHAEPPKKKRVETSRWHMWHVLMALRVSANAHPFI